MNMTIDLWQLLVTGVSILTAFSGATFGFGKLLLSQFEQRLDTRFKNQDQQQQAAQTHMDTRFTWLEQSMTRGNEEALRIERELMALKAELPNNYVRREDYIRNQTVIESKIDGLAVRIENAILKGERHG